MLLCPPALGKESAPTEWISVKCDINIFFKNWSKNFEVPLKCDMNNGKFTCSKTDTFEQITFGSS
jgi:hypothetical protein